VNVVITLGPTQEPIDSIRYITTGSSGKMGCALAKEAVRRGHKVTIVAGPIGIDLPDKTNNIRVRSASEMTEKTLAELEKGADILISSAAIADYTPAKREEGKIKSGIKGLRIDLMPTKKLTHEARKRFPELYIAAFKAEHSIPYEELIRRAENKLKKEDLDLIAANDIGENAFGSDMSEVTVLDRSGIVRRTGKETKERIAKKILDIIEKRKE
jgi:phosphopantothenoylcysteine decarboxylase/phosphopantothenate--cysteine ligase